MGAFEDMIVGAADADMADGDADPAGAQRRPRNVDEGEFPGSGQSMARMFGPPGGEVSAARRGRELLGAVAVRARVLPAAQATIREVRRSRWRGRPRRVAPPENQLPTTIRTRLPDGSRTSMPSAISAKA